MKEEILMLSKNMKNKIQQIKAVNNAIIFFDNLLV